MIGEGWIDFGMALNAAYWQALHDWRDEYAPGHRVEDLFANHLRRVTLASNSHPGGTAELMVRVRSRAPRQNETYFWKLTHIGGLYYFV